MDTHLDGEKFDNVLDYFLRPIQDPRTTNAPIVAKPTVKVKTELQVLRLNEESQKLTMETLRAIHGDNFSLDDASKYKDFGHGKKNGYWEDRGTLTVQGVSNFSESSRNPTDPLRRFALLKLENYGFPESHCIEAYDYCDCNTENALLLLFEKYMVAPQAQQICVPQSETHPSESSEDELLDIRCDERAALESIYGDVFQEKERNCLWSFQFQIDHLLAALSPSAQRKAREAATAAAKAPPPKKKEPERCRNFERDGMCKFGSKCRFTHVRAEPVETTTKKTLQVYLATTEPENCFHLEVRFPPGSRYPYEAPYIYLKTSCHDIPREVLLRIARRLYREACELSKDGMPSVYSISELLQMDEQLVQFLRDDYEPFLSPEKSIFFVEEKKDTSASKSEQKPLPTHYERGQTSRNDCLRRNTGQYEREDRALMRRFLERQDDERYRKMMCGRRNLPAFDKMIEILGLIEESQVLVVSGETGCGKSTQIPQFILDNWLFQASRQKSGEIMPHVEIICTQPRRLSAVGVAERVAEERAERVGQIVGYQIRLENKISSNTRLTFCTTGILLRRLVSDPLLETVTHVVVDEVHERSEESDFLIALLKDILKQRPDLKVILMSATLNAKLFSEYFGGAPVLDIPGRTYPVEQLFLEDILEVCDFVMECDSQYCRKITKKEETQLLQELEYADIKSANEAPMKKAKDETLNLAAIYARYSDYSKKTCKSIFLMEPMRINPELIESVLKYIVDGVHEWPRTGSILIFLPGLQEIQLVHDALTDSSEFGPRADKYILVPLHSMLTVEEQSLVFRPAPKGKRKIVLSTNIAETSVTIDDCTFVIDCGLMKEKGFDPMRNMESLELVWVSRANALQRKGRAGRVMPGVCIHLFTSHRYKHNILSQPVPEIHRVPLEQLLLRIKTLPNFNERNVIEVLGQTLEPPTEENIISAVKRLENVGALDEAQNLTPLGHHLAALPVDVRIGKLMLFGAIFQCLDSVLTIAACLSSKSPFVSPFSKREEADRRKREFAICNSDHLTCLLAYKKWLDVTKRNIYASRNFANEHYLSLNTLQNIGEVKYQFLELLVSIGFVPVNVPRKRKNVTDNILELTGVELNKNCGNNRLLVSLLCAALYPNIVKVLTPERSYVQTAGGAVPKPSNPKDLKFKTQEDGYVAIHPSSVNSNVGVFQSPFLVYQEKVKTSRIFIRECSMLSLTSLILFSGSEPKIQLCDGDFLFLLENDWITIKAQSHQVAEMVHCLRIELFKLLEEKIADPCLNLLNHENGRKIIQTIVYLVTNNN